jgi:putative ATP-dependent endonuclease of OLD family
VVPRHERLERGDSMRLGKLKIRNFRCFGPDETQVFLNDFVALIGANSTGKTALMHALLKLFGDQELRQLRKSDFHVPDDMDPSEMNEASMYIEAVLVFPELRQSGDDANRTVPPFFNHMIVQEPNSDPYVRIRLTAEWMKTASPEGDIDSRLEYIIAPEGEESPDKIIKVQARHRALIQVSYVPAMRDPSVHLRSSSNAILWRLLKSVQWSEELRSEVQSLSKDLDKVLTSQSGVQTIRNILQDCWSNLHHGIRYGHTDVKFSPSELDDILKRVQVAFRPTPTGGEHSVDQLGDGLRSLFFLSMVATFLGVESQATKNAESGLDVDAIGSPALRILAVEEPENHLSPHLLGRIVKLCNELASHSRCQVLISSHTPSLLRRVRPEDIRYFRREACGKTVVSEITLPPDVDEAGKYVREAVRAYPEIYFSKLVVLGEGESEEIVLGRAIEACGYGLDKSEISIVPLGGRHVNHFWKLLNDLGIPHVTLLDLDREREGGGWARIQYVIQQLLALGLPRESLLRVSSKRGTRVLSDEEFDKMSSWDATKTGTMARWLEYLEQYGVFFAEPLDLDFLMLYAFPDEYKKSISRGRGPCIPASPEERSARLADAAKVVLGLSEPPKTYSDEQIELFPWYTYLFLRRSKPTTHLAALRLMDDQSLAERLPPVLKRLAQRVSELIGLLGEDPGSHGSS